MAFSWTTYELQTFLHGISISFKAGFPDVAEVTFGTPGNAGTTASQHRGSNHAENVSPPVSLFKMPKCSSEKWSSEIGCELSPGRSLFAREDTLFSKLYILERVPHLEKAPMKCGCSFSVQMKLTGEVTNFLLKDYSRTPSFSHKGSLYSSS